MSTLIEVQVDDRVPVTGYLVLDSFVGGEAHGGLRIAADVTAERLREAARTMTLKYGWAGLPVGGAKAGILVPNGTKELDRTLMIRNFGRAIEPFLTSGRYVPGEDMGSTVDDIKVLLRAAGLHPKPWSLMFAASGLYTGVGVCAAALATAAVLDLPAKDLRVSIEGFGTVGSSAARRFHQAGAKVVAVSTIKGGLYDENGLDVPALLSLRRRHGDDCVLRYEKGEALKSTSLVAVPAHVFCPCGVMHSITMENVGSVRAGIVCPGANVPATDEAQTVLEERGVAFIPDFVANCGGVMGSSMSRAGLQRDEVAAIVARRLHEKTELLVIDAREQQRTLRDMATELSLRDFAEAKARYEQKSATQALLRLGVGIYRRGLVPRPLLRPLGRRYYNFPQP
jgi:glutamate dehydrogenase (NAD(P)+)